MTKGRGSPVHARMKAQARAARARDAALHTRQPSVFESLTADALHAAAAVTFPPGHCYPRHDDGCRRGPIVGHQDGTFSELLLPEHRHEVAP